MRNLTLITTFIFLAMSILTAKAQTPEEKGLAIARQIEAANKGFVGEESKMKMVLIDAHGSKVERAMIGKVMEVESEGDRSLSIFESPLDVQGTMMLTWSKKESDDEQWLFLPSVRRVKRITSRQQSASFLGSEFSYEDLGSQEIEKYNYKWLKDEKKNGQDVWVVERVPKKTSGYSKQIMYVRKDLKSPIQVDYYDRRNELLKTAEFDQFKAYTVAGKKLNRPHRIHMKNLQTKKESIFEWEERQLGVKHNPQDFEQRSLR